MASNHKTALCTIVRHAVKNMSLTCNTHSKSAAGIPLIMLSSPSSLTPYLKGSNYNFITARHTSHLQ